MGKASFQWYSYLLFVCFVLGLHGKLIVDILQLLAILLISCMRREEFEAIVVRAINNLPQEFQHKLDNVDIVIENWPTPRQLRQIKHSHPNGLLGLYQGVPQTKRGRRYGLVLPDKISIFQKPIETQCRSGDEIEEKIGEVVRHEIAHHFGLDERALRKITEEKRRRK